jgi:hypothetical protein
MCFNPYSMILKELNPLNDISRFQNTKLFVKRLRIAFAKRQTIDYKNANNRAAYMLSYYPFYIKPISYVLTKNLININLKENLNIAFIGCGAAPELVGLGYFLRENKIDIVKNIHADFFDRNDDYWKKSRLISEKLFKNMIPVKLETNPIFCNFYNTNSDCINQYKCTEVFPQTDIVVLQNFIGDMPNQEPNIKKELAWIFNLVKSGCLIIIIDFKYPRTKDLLNAIEFELSRNFNDCVILNSQNDSYTEMPGFELPKILKETIFTGEVDLVPKEKTRFIYTVIKRG